MTIGVLPCVDLLGWKRTALECFKISCGASMRIAIVGSYNAGIKVVSAALNRFEVYFGQPTQENQLDTVPLIPRLRHWWSEPMLVASISAVARRSQLARWAQNLEETASLVAVAHPLLSLCLDDLKVAWGPSVRFLWCHSSSTLHSSIINDSSSWPEFDRVQATLNESLDKFFTAEPHLNVDVDQLIQNPDENLRAIVDFLRLKVTDEQLHEVAGGIASQLSSSTTIASQSSNLARATAGGESSQPMLPPCSLPRTSKIVATILSGNSETLIEPAILSALDWVDQICLIDTGISDHTITKAQAIAGDRLSRWSFPWCNDFAAARNAALEAANMLQATWAMTLDTDERIEFPGFRDREHLRETLESRPEVISWMVPIRDGSYVKERFVRVPTRLEWQGCTHEALYGATDSERKVLSGCWFSEVAKSPADYEFKLQRDLAILLKETTAFPLTARWWYYLGQTYEGMRKYREAVEAFDQCIRLDDWSDESSWACYLAARSLVAIKEFREAEEYCALGMTRKPTAAEHPWLAGWCCFQRGAARPAIAWSQLAITLAQNASARDEATFRHLPAWYEGPYDVLRYAYQRIDAPQLAQQAEIDFQAAMAARVKLLEGSSLKAD